MSNEEKKYLLSESELKKLMEQSYTNGFEAAYKSILRSLLKGVEELRNDSEEEADTGESVDVEPQGVDENGSGMGPESDSE